MGRPSHTGVRGLYADSTYVDKDGREVDADAGGKKMIRYRIDLRHRGGRYKERLPPGTPLAAAKDHAQDILVLAMSGKLVKGAKGAPTKLRAAFDQYLEWIEGPGAAEYVEPVRALKDKGLHCKAWTDAIGDVPLSTLGPAVFDKFKAQQAGRDVGPATVNRRLTTMKHFIKWAAARGWIEKVRAVEMRTEELKLLPEPAGRIRWLKDDERARLDKVLTPEIKSLAWASVFSGLRLGNVVRMKKTDVDLQARNLAALVKRKGQRKRIDLPVNDTLAAILEAAMARSETEYVFVNRLGQPYTMSGASSFFRKKAAEAKVSDFSFHDLRHDFATRVRRGGQGLDVIKDLLGHSDIKMSMRYAHVGREALRAAVATLDVVATAGPELPPGPTRRKKK